MLYIDSNVFIYPALYDVDSDKKAAAAKGKLLQIAKGELEASTCWLTWDEVVWIVRRFVGEREAREQGKVFLGLPNLRMLDVDSKVIARAQDLLEVYGLRPRDAVHAAAAIVNGDREILSEDPDFDKVEELRRRTLL